MSDCSLHVLGIARWSQGEAPADPASAPPNLRGSVPGSLRRDVIGNRLAWEGDSSAGWVATGVKRRRLDPMPENNNIEAAGSYRPRMHPIAVRGIKGDLVIPAIAL